MPYRNDVFISYKRGRLAEEWLDSFFLYFFEEYLDNELGRKSNIFVDRKGLTQGVEFDEALFEELIGSRCLVSIWSPLYFNASEWCVKELLTTKYRQEFYKLSNSTKPKTLLWPVVTKKIDPMPEAFKNIHYFDYSQYFLVGDAIRRDPRYLQFQDDLRKDILLVADIVKNAPAFEESWATDAGRDQLKSDLNEYFKTGSNLTISQSPIQW
jgi:TIR domain